MFRRVVLFAALLISAAPFSESQITQIPAPGVTSVAASGCLSGGTVTSTGTISVQQSGTSYLWNGICLTGVAFGATSVVNVTSGNAAVLATGAANKRTIVSVMVQNPTSTTATYAIFKNSVAAYACTLLSATTINGISNGVIAGASAILEPSETLSVAVSVAGQVNFSATTLSYDNSIPLRQPTTYGFTSGVNTVYTVPTGYTALMFPVTGWAQPPSIAGGQARFLPDVSTTANMSISIGGTTWVSTFSQGASTQISTFQFPQILSTGTAIVFNYATDSSTGCVTMPSVYERRNS